MRDWTAPYVFPHENFGLPVCFSQKQLWDRYGALAQWLEEVGSDGTDFLEAA